MSLVFKNYKEFSIFYKKKILFNIFKRFEVVDLGSEENLLFLIPLQSVHFATVSTFAFYAILRDIFYRKSNVKVLGYNNRRLLLNHESLNGAQIRGERDRKSVV